MKKIDLHAKHFYYHKYIYLINKENTRLKALKLLNIEFFILNSNVKFESSIFIQFYQSIDREDILFHFYNQVNDRQLNVLMIINDFKDFNDDDNNNNINDKVDEKNNENKNDDDDENEFKMLNQSLNHDNSFFFINHQFCKDNNNN